MGNFLHKIESFTDLIAWQEGHQLVLMIYEITKKFPKEEIYNLVSQMRRCVVSVTSNIAEGFGRKTWKEKNQFYMISNGSLSELKNQLLIAKDLGYIQQMTFQAANQILEKTQKLIYGLARSSSTY